MASWAIATTCKDVPEVVLAFVAHHLEAGAHEIFLFLDDPDDPAARHLAGLDRVHVHRCDADHWAGLGISRPPSHLRRQTANADHARARSGAEWTGHIDIDEFLWSDTPFGTVFDGVEEDALLVLPAERIFETVPPRTGVVFDSGFKLRMPNDRAREIFGPHGPVMFRGFQGHNIGKTFLRTRVQGRLGIHKAFGADGAEIAAHEEYDRARLLHFFPFGFPAWEEKFSRRLDDPKYLARLPGPGRRKFNLLARAREQGGDAVWELFLALSYFDPARLRMLKRLGFHFKPELDLPGAVRRVFGPDAPGAGEPAKQGSRRGALDRLTRAFGGKA